MKRLSAEEQKCQDTTLFFSGRALHLWCYKAVSMYSAITRFQRLYYSLR